LLSVLQDEETREKLGGYVKTFEKEQRRINTLAHEAAQRSAGEIDLLLGELLKESGLGKKREWVM
jgi:hypothetical protein